MPPQLSICIPTYNRCQCLKESLDSLWTAVEGFNDRVEIVISDNASPDETKEVVLGFADKFKNLKYYKNNENIGATRNIFKVLSHAEGEYVWVFGDDDKILARSISLFFELIEKKYDFIIFNYSIWSKDFSSQKISSNIRLKNDCEFKSGDEVLEKMGTQPGYISCVLYKRQIFTQFPDFERDLFIDYGYPQLYMFYRGIFPDKKGLYVSEPLVQNRSDNSKGFNWYKFNVEGLSKILNNLVSLGYSRQSSRKTQNYIIFNYIFWHILVMKRDGVRVLNHFPLMFKYYKGYFLFWLAVVPCLLIPPKLLGFIYHLRMKFKKRITS